MARDYATINTGIWGNPDVRALPLEHQALYLQLWTHPDLTYAGVLDWRPARIIAPLSAGSTAATIEDLVPLLEERLFVLVDHDTEEVLVRSYLRHDGLLKNPKTAVSMTKAYAAVGSNMLRGVIVHELARLRLEFPSWAAWATPQVATILKHPAIDPRTLVLSSPSVTPSPSPSVTPYPTGKHTTTATTTATEASLLRDPGEAKLKETRLPASWAPIPSHFTLAKERGVDITAEADAFRLHAETHDRHAARWNAAFTTWLKKARPGTVASAIAEDPSTEWMRR